VAPASFDIGKLLIFAGLALALAGGVVLLVGRLPFGQLPGDISGSRGGFSFAIPLGTCILVSVVLTIALNIFFRLRR